MLITVTFANFGVTHSIHICSKAARHWAAFSMQVRDIEKYRISVLPTY